MASVLVSVLNVYPALTDERQWAREDEQTRREGLIVFNLQIDALTLS